jgi:hypothetical protein
MMKRILILTLVMILLFVSVSPALAGNGNGNGGGEHRNGQDGSGNTNRHQNQHTERHENRNGDGQPDFYVITGVVTAINADTGSITVLVYGGKDTSLHGTEVVVQTNASTRFVLKDYGPITFDEVVVGDPVSVAIGSDGIADRVTVGAEIACIPT